MIQWWDYVQSVICKSLWMPCEMPKKIEGFTTPHHGFKHIQVEGKKSLLKYMAKNLESIYYRWPITILCYKMCFFFTSKAGLNVLFYQ